MGGAIYIYVYVYVGGKNFSVSFVDFIFFCFFTTTLPYIFNTKQEHINISCSAYQAPSLT